jgi:uncharacterized cofD-like protein
MSEEQQNWWNNFLQRLKREARWLMPGIGVKRWLLMILVGITMLAVGLSFILLNIYRTAPDTWVAPALRIISLAFLHRTVRAVIFGLVGLILTFVGMWGLNRSLLRPFIQPGKPIIDAVTEFRRKERGPRIVVIGGGHGLATLLRGLKGFTKNLTAIVTVADDGGSSGEIRRTTGILPPGDIRNCLAALSNDEELMTQLFQYRFSDETGLQGHALGNLLITGLAEITGSFEEAIVESGRVLAVQGQVLPSTLTDVRLVASVEEVQKKRNIKIRGESRIPKANGQVKRLYLEPDSPPAYPPAIQAILSADLIIVGPGSLYTSLLPNLLVPDIRQAIQASKGMKFYVCNLASQKGETEGYNGLDHVAAIEKHVGGRLFDLILCNNNYMADIPEDVNWVRVDGELERNYPIYQTDLLDVEHPWRHDSNKLANVIMDIYYDRTGPLTERELPAVAG